MNAPHPDQSRAWSLMQWLGVGDDRAMDRILTDFDEVRASATPKVGPDDIPGPDGYEEFVVNGGFPGGPYLTQWKLGAQPDGSKLRVHRIHRSDEDEEFHDHPWNFRSLILHGSYVEFTPDRPDNEGTVYQPGDWNVKRATDLHRLAVIGPAPVITLMWRGPRVRRWGFQKRGGEWLPYEDFLDRKHGKGNWRTE